MPADPEGRWHAKDQLAHLAWWRDRSARAVDAARTGEAVSPEEADDTRQNAVIYAETRDRPAAEIKRMAADSWEALKAALEKASEADLARPHPYHPEAQVWEAVPGMGGHLGSHLMSWLMDEGKVERAEAVARWGYEFECGLVPEGEKRADAAYNLACFFARAGRADEALPLLQESLASSAELRGWAREDHDLDALRDDPRFKALLSA